MFISHTQLPKDHLTSYILNSEAVGPKTFVNNYEYGNFLFLLRSYRKAIKAYKVSITERLDKQKEIKKIQKIQKILGNNSGQYDKVLYNSFKNILTINAKVLRKPRAAINLFKGYLSSSQVPKYVKQDLEMWIKELKRWENSKDLNIKFKNDEEIGAFIQKYLVKLDQEGMGLATGEYDVDLLVTSGILSNYLTDNPKNKYAPEILYWIGISESRLSKNMFFTLGDLYLKECITRYPKSKIAIKCYSEYENEIQFRFTGTLGTKMPRSKKVEIKKPKKL